jgi:23S rRNA (uracil1939-C5)-methyltransferase
MSIETLHIERLGQRGDGIAERPAGPVYVAGALPGEVVEADVSGERGRLLGVLTASPARVEPPCPLFGQCGGCATQHIAPQLYAEWKRDLVLAALHHAGIETDIAPLMPAHGAGRRRVTFHARAGGRLETEAPLVGFMAARSHDLVGVSACPLLVPELAAAPDVARRIAAVLGRSGKPLDIQLTATAGGIDVDVRGHGPASSSRRGALAQLAADCKLARLSVHGDVVAELAPPEVSMGGAVVILPPGGFLQATAAGEAALGALVLEAVGNASRVADLFAGVGPFALRLARSASVLACENDEAALAALDRAARHARGLRPVTVEARDLFRRPLVGPELADVDAVVMDPPRAGAEAQSRSLAASAVPVVASVSCNPTTFARDARILLDGGYRLVRVTPVDQFLHSAHVELVGTFVRPARAAGPRRRRGILG